MQCIQILSRKNSQNNAFVLQIRAVDKDMQEREGGTEGGRGEGGEGGTSSLCPKMHEEGNIMLMPRTFKNHTPQYPQACNGTPLTAKTVIRERAYRHSTSALVVNKCQVYNTEISILLQTN